MKNIDDMNPAEALKATMQLFHEAACPAQYEQKRTKRQKFKNSIMRIKLPDEISQQEIEDRKEFEKQVLPSLTK